MRKVSPVKASGRKVTMRIEEDTGTPDTQGGHTPNWTTASGLGNEAMEFVTLNAFQIFHLQQIYPKVNVQLKMRYRGSVAVTTTMRAVWGNHIYMIRGAENWDQNNDTIVLTCEELRAKGSKR